MEQTVARARAIMEDYLGEGPIPLPEFRGSIEGFGQVSPELAAEAAETVVLEYLEAGRIRVHLARALDAESPVITGTAAREEIARRSAYFDGDGDEVRTWFSVVACAVADPPAWLAGLAHDPGDPPMVHRVAELLPSGYAAYLRLFHPFTAWGADLSSTHEDDQRRSWSSLAREAGAEFTGQLTWESLSPVVPSQGLGRRYAVGHLDAVTRGRLVACLRDSTKDQNVSFFYGLSAVMAGRDSVVYVAPLDASDRIAATARSSGFVHESPEYMWPDDRSWLVCSDFDLESTYIACGAELSAKLLAEPGLEILPVPHTARVDGRADFSEPPSDTVASREPPDAEPSR